MRVKCTEMYPLPFPPDHVGCTVDVGNPESVPDNDEVIKGVLFCARLLMGPHALVFFLKRFFF